MEYYSAVKMEHTIDKYSNRDDPQNIVLSKGSLTQDGTYWIRAILWTYLSIKYKSYVF